MRRPKTIVQSLGAFLWTRTGQRSDGRTLLGAAPGSEIEVDEGNVDLQMMMRWVAIRSGNWETEKLRGNNLGGIDQVGGQSKTRRHEGNAR